MIAFWVAGTLAVVFALCTVLVPKAVYGALSLAAVMICLAILYITLDAPFLAVVQVIVYTGAVMMLFLFVLMLVGRDSSDSVVEVLRGQRLAGAVLGLGFAALVVGALARALTDVPSAGLAGVNSTGGGNVGQIGTLLFTQYLFVFELTSALLIVAALGAMALAFTASDRAGKLTQRERVVARLRGERISPLPGPGVFATANSVATPALLPDGSIAPDSLSAILDATVATALNGQRAQVRGAGQAPSARSLSGGPRTSEGRQP